MARALGISMASRPGKDARQRAWAAIRYLMKSQGRFTDGDIISIAEIGASNLWRYLKVLAETGYVRVIGKHQSSHRMGYAIYELARDTGPKHPIAHNDGQVYDQNTKETYGPERTEVACRAKASV
jgi:DNA-binding IclR family transcriptional regulator